MNYKATKSTKIRLAMKSEINARVINSLFTSDLEYCKAVEVCIIDLFSDIQVENRIVRNCFSFDQFLNIVKNAVSILTNSDIFEKRFINEAKSIYYNTAFFYQYDQLSA